MENKPFTIIVSDVHEPCPKCFDDGGANHTVNYWKELMKCKKCGTLLKKDDTPFYTHAILYNMNSSFHQRDEILISVRKDKSYKVEYILRELLGGIVKEVEERKEEETKGNNGKTYTNVIFRIKFLGAIRAHK